jgi:hypothetical protein
MAPCACLPIRAFRKWSKYIRCSIIRLGEFQRSHNVVYIRATNNQYRAGQLANFGNLQQLSTAYSAVSSSNAFPTTGTLSTRLLALKPMRRLLLKPFLFLRYRPGINETTETVASLVLFVRSGTVRNAASARLVVLAFGPDALPVRLCAVLAASA